MGFLSVCFFALLSANAVQAGMLSNAQVIPQNQQAYDKQMLLQALHRTEVQAQLAALGVSAVDIETRINQMTPQELATLNHRMEEQPAGGIVGFLVLLFAIFVITDAAGVTDIFPFVHPL